ncbi:ubiquinone-dependent pyruvate dehydrogenase [Acidisarcina polymorpha]
MTLGELLIETLAQAGVKRIYGVPGDSLNAVTDVIRRNKNIEWSHVRNEEAGAFAAGAEAHLTGQLAVCAGSCGPGNLHLINGLYDAHRSRVPVLAIAAQIPSTEIGSNYFQETHPEVLYRECSHYVEVISTAEQMPLVLQRAMQTAISMRGVAVVVLPGDLAGHEASVTPPRISWPNPVTLPSAAEIEQLAALLNQGRKVTILGGAGCAGAHSELLEVAAKLKAPIVHSLRGKEFIEYDNPFDVGLTGLLGFESGAYAIMDADVLLMLGTDFPYRAFLPQKATVIQIDIRGEQLGRRVKLDLGLVGDVRATLAAVSPRLNDKGESTHLDKSIQHYRHMRQTLDDLAKGEAGERPIHPQYLAKVLNEVAAEDAIFTCDVGTPVLWAARYLQMNGKRRLLGSFNHGSMANALSQALGAQSAFPGRQVISMSGDGGLAMLMGEILTLRQMNLPVKIVLFQNNALGFVELEMKAAGILAFGTDLVNPDFSDIGRAAGLLGLRAETADQVRPMLQQALAHDGPALVEVLVNRQELSIPPTITSAQAKGFSLYMMRAVLSGRGDEVLDLASPNTLKELIEVAKENLLA